MKENILNHFINPHPNHLRDSTCVAELHDKRTIFFENVRWILLLRRRSKWRDCERTGNNFVKQSLDNISERLLTPETLLVDAADCNGVETAKNELELGAETEGTLSSLFTIVNNATTALVTTSLCLQENVTSL